MLLWTGAVLCFLAYGIQAAMEDEPANDNVRGNAEKYVCSFTGMHDITANISVSANICLFLKLLLLA